ncbi:helix-turn-helix domain-containing protein [Endozoicomonas sp. SCSIO W0465]
MKTKRAYTERFYPTPEQEILLAQSLRILVNLNTYSVSFEHPELLTHCPV